MQKNVGNVSSELGTCSINSPPFTHGEENPSKSINLEPKPTIGMEVSPRRVSASQMQQNISARSCDASVSPLARLHQHDIKTGKYADNQWEEVNLPTIPTSNDDVQKHNYSLLQQMLAMKGTVSDPSMIAAKRFERTDCSADDSTLDCAVGERYITEQNALCRVSDAALHPRNVKMLRFLSSENEERSANGSSHIVVGELESARQPTYCRLQELQNSSPSRSSILALSGGNEHHLINPQISSWFEQYKFCIDNQISVMSDSIGISQSNTKAASEHYIFSKTLEPMDNVAIMENRDNIPENLSPAGMAVE